jgi:hypothetical protein
MIIFIKPSSNSLSMPHINNIYNLSSGKWGSYFIPVPKQIIYLENYSIYNSIFYKFAAGPAVPLR